MVINPDMRISRLVVMGLLMLATNGSVYASLPERFPGFSDAQITRPQRVVEIFLQAVDRGELMVFDTAITRSMLTPLRVEFSYTLDDPSPVLKVYSELKQPLEVPGQDNCEVRAVSVILDDQGQIIESKAHVWME